MYRFVRVCTVDVVVVGGIDGNASDGCVRHAVQPHVHRCLVQFVLIPVTAFESGERHGVLVLDVQLHVCRHVFGKSVEDEFYRQLFAVESVVVEVAFQSVIHVQGHTFYGFQYHVWRLQGLHLVVDVVFCPCHSQVGEHVRHIGCHRAVLALVLDHDGGLALVHGRGGEEAVGGNAEAYNGGEHEPLPVAEAAEEEVLQGHFLVLLCLGLRYWSLCGQVLRNVFVHGVLWCFLGACPFYEVSGLFPPPLKAGCR